MFPESKAEKPVVDVSRYEVALNGQAVRNLHSINDGAYGGETLIVWDKEKQASSTTTSRPAASTRRARCGRRTALSSSHEIGQGRRRRGERGEGGLPPAPDGRLHAKTQYLKQGEWVMPATCATSTPSATVEFKD